METPYLARGREHAVRWRDWGDGAFAEAKRAGKPLFVLSGASWCTASTTLDVEAFSDPDVAKRLNRAFTPVRIDRDERPDIDDRLQALTQAATNQAGWPLGAFLTPDGELFHAGTRFSRNPVGGRPPLAEVLDRTSTAFSDNPSRAAAFAKRIEEEIRAAAKLPRGTEKERSGRKPARIDLAPLLAAHDARHGGFTGEPKFPLPLAFQALLFSGIGDRKAREVAHAGLSALARSPLHDHVGGGFYRLSKSEDWEEPVREKRLTDNAELLSLFAAASREWKEPAFRRAAMGILRWSEEIPGTSQTGSPADDAWTGAELNRILMRHERILLSEISGAKRASDDRIGARQVTIAVRVDPATAAKKLRKTPAQLEADMTALFEKLADARRKKCPEPPVDPTPWTASIARMARSLIACAGPLGQADRLTKGVAIVDRLATEAGSPDGTVCHATGGSSTLSFSADHAQLGLALLAVHSATQERRHLETARRIADRLIAVFCDRTRGGFYDVDPTSADPFCRRFPMHPLTDLPDPSANGVAALFLARLGKSLGPTGTPYVTKAQETIAAFPKGTELYGPFAGGFTLAALEAGLASR